MEGGENLLFEGWILNWLSPHALQFLWNMGRPECSKVLFTDSQQSQPSLPDALSFAQCKALAQTALGSQKERSRAGSEGSQPILLVTHILTEQVWVWIGTIVLPELAGAFCLAAS